MEEKQEGPKDPTASTTKGFRTTEGTKERAEKALEAAGLPKGTDLLGFMANLVEMQNMKTGNFGYSTQIEELEYHTKRIIEHYLAMLQTEGALRSQIREDHAAVQAKSAEQLHAAAAEIQELKATLKVAEETLAEVVQAAEERAKTIKSLEAVSEKNEELVMSYKKEIGELQATVSRQVESIENAVRLELSLQETKGKLADLSKDLQEEQKARQEAERHGQEEVARTEAIYKERLERLQEKADLQRQTEIVQLRAELQAAANDAAEKRLDEIRDLFMQLAGVKDELATVKDERGGLERELADVKAKLTANEKTSASRLRKTAEKGEEGTE